MVLYTFIKIWYVLNNITILITILIIHPSNHSNFEHLWPCIYVTFRLLGAKCRIVHDKSLMVEWFTCWKDIKLLLTSHPVKSKTTFSFYLLHICRYISCGLWHSYWLNNLDFVKPSKGVYAMTLELKQNCRRYIINLKHFHTHYIEKLFKCISNVANYDKNTGYGHKNLYWATQRN